MSVTDAFQQDRLAAAQADMAGSLIESGTDAIIGADRNGRVALWNRAAATIFGWTAAEVIGRPMELIVPPRFREAHKLGMARFVAGEPAKLMGKTVQVAALAKDGHEFPIELTLWAWGSGEGLGVGAVIRDVSAREVARTELRQAKARLETAARESEAARETMKLLVRSATTALVMTDADLRVMDVSDRWTEAYDRPRETVTGRTMHELFPGGRERWDPIYQRCLGGARVRSEDPEPTSGFGGSRRWVQWEVAPWRDAAGVVAGLLLTNHDVTPLVSAKVEVEAEHRRLMMAVEIAHLIVWELDFAARSLRIHGGDPDSLLGVPITYEGLERDEFLIVHPDDKARCQAAWRNHVQGGVAYNVEHRLPHADREVWVSSRVELFRDASGRAKGILGVVKDITARKTWEIETHRARDAAEASNRAKDEFLANMSHEIRTPLNGVLGVAGALALSSLDAGQAEMVTAIEESGRDLERLLTGCLELIAADDGAAELRREPLDLAAIVDQLRAQYAHPAAARGLELRVDVHGRESGRCLGDEDRIRGVLTRLLDNALKFTKRGAVTLALDVQRSGDRVGARFRVEDTGVGFDPALAGGLFDRFRQADGSATRRFGGSGLGLAVCRSLADAMGATLEASSRPGTGSNFTLALDLDPVPEASVPAKSAGRVRVLLAEDHPTNRKVVELILEGAGVELTCVETGEEAVHRAAAAGFDLILMDMHMPVMDGLTAIRAIRAREAGQGARRTPIYTLTANAMPEHAAAALSAGADEHLTKPISAARLLGAVKRAGDTERAEVPAAA